MFDGGIACARADEARDGVTELVKLGQLLLDRSELLLGPSANRAAGGPRPCLQGQELLRLRQREAEPSSVAHEAEPSDGFFAVSAVAPLLPALLRQDADALVVPNRLDADPGTLRESADGEGLFAHVESMGSVPRYRVKRFRCRFDGVPGKAIQAAPCSHFPYVDRGLCYPYEMVRGVSTHYERAWWRSRRRWSGLLVVLPLACGGGPESSAPLANAASSDAGTDPGPYQDASTKDAPRTLVEDLTVEPMQFVDGTLVPISDGETFTLKLAAQGGWYVFTGAQAHGHAGPVVELHTRLFDEGTGYVFASATRVVEMAEASPGTSEWRPWPLDFRSLNHLSVCPADGAPATDSAALVLEVRMVESTSDGVLHAGTATRRVALVCPPVGSGVSCACECNPTACVVSP